MPRKAFKGMRIIKVLLDKPDGSLTKYRLAKIAGCTHPLVMQLIKKLEEKKLVRSTRVLQFDKLVDYYLEIAPKQSYAEYYVKDPINFLKKSKLDYALTTYGAENLLSHHLFPTRYDIYVKKEDFEAWKRLIMKNGLLGKGNLRLIFTDDEKIFSDVQKIKGIKLVSLAQLLIDLKREKGVCIEAYTILVKRNVQKH